MSISVSVEKTPNGNLKVRAPYHASFNHRAKLLGGRFKFQEFDDGRKFPLGWFFSAESEPRVRQALMEVFATDGTETAETCTIRVECSEGVSRMRSGVEIDGRSLCYARSRDGGSKLGDKVELLEGCITSGGSMKWWETVIKPNTVFLVHEFPRARAEILVREQDPECWYRVFIIENSSQPDPSVLLTEKARLQARIAEIDDLLAGAGQ